MQICITRSITVEIYDSDDHFEETITTCEFDPGDKVTVEPADEDLCSEGSTGFLFWDTGFGEIPDDAFQPVPTAESGQVMRILARIEKRLASSVEKESYTTEEVAERLGKSPWTIRQWCNQGQVNGRKIHGREWRISHNELVRLQNDGPLPVSQRAP